MSLMQRWYAAAAPDAVRRRKALGEIRDCLTRTRVNVAVVGRELDEHLADVDRVTALAAELPIYPDRLAEPRGITVGAARA